MYKEKKLSILLSASQFHLFPTFLSNSSRFVAPPSNQLIHVNSSAFVPPFYFRLMLLHTHTHTHRDTYICPDKEFGIEYKI